MSFNIQKFFLGANSPSGFFSYFDNLYSPNDSWFCYILKGGPGCGKSSLMKKIASKAKEKSIDPEVIYCSSDPESLDAVILDSLKVSIVDGTSPHTMDPIYPGLTDKIINLGKFWDEKTLVKNNREILNKFKQNSLFHFRANMYLKACKSIKNNIEKLASSALNTEKTVLYSQKLSKKLFKKISTKKGKEKIRFISAITPSGIIFYEETVFSLCDKIFLIDDRFSVVGPIMLEIIKKHALELGHDVISCFSPFDPKYKLECLIFPQSGIAFAVCNSDHPLDKLSSNCKKINSMRFLDKKIISSNSRLLNSDKKLQQNLLHESIDNLRKAKEIHDIIENYYVSSTDFSEIDRISEKLVDEIFG